VEKWPPNVLVDGKRDCWLPDDWGQAVKNTGPGGVYLGWVSPEGKFFYHRRGYPSAIEEHLGRKLTALDGINGVRRAVSQRVPPGADKAFLNGCLSAAERKHVLDAKGFHFAVISARRATSDDGQHGIMLVEGYCHGAGIKPTWYVDKESLDDYKKLGLDAVVGGKLTPARNMALDTAKRRGQVCVQISDDISKWEYFDVEKQDFSGQADFSKMNAAVRGSKRLYISPLAAAQFILAKMRSSPLKPQLGGVFPTLNAAMSLGNEEYSTHHFILGDFFVAEPTSPCRFDTSMTLKEDYDYSCSHIRAHGSVLRCNRMFAHARHATNSGGAVATRDATGAKERANIAILQRKWPGVFYLNGKRKDEVIMKWGDKATPQPSSRSRSAASTRAKPTKKANAKGYKAKDKMLGYKATAKVKYIREKGYSSVPYLNRRCAKLDGKTVEACLQSRFKDAAGCEKPYRLTDLKYDEAAGRLRILK